ncbi:MAG TPA: MBL fold metallo-hydrolase [Anaerolineales bacterium]|nr:MBL fold metallo-hydrolase [Anaerolineales bacterium]
MRRLAEGILYTEPKGETDRPVLGIISGSKRSLMVDGGNSPSHAQAFLDELSQHHLRMPDFVAITHAHCDHIFGLSLFDSIVIANRITNDKITELQQRPWDDDSVAARVKSGQEHEMTAHMLKLEMPGDRSEFKIREPELIYENRLVVDLGDMTCHIQRIGGDHATDSAVIYVPERSVAFIGDCLYLRHTDRATVRELFEKLLSFPVDTYIDSHEVTPISRAELQERYRSLGLA